MSESDYYREKILKLVNTLFIDTGDAKTRLINSAKHIDAAYYASKFPGIPEKVIEQWEKVNKELAQGPEWHDSRGVLRTNSVSNSISGKWNSSMEKYLLFFLEEFYRVLRRKES